MSDQNLKDDAYWRDKLSAEQYRICREKGTEPAFSGEYWNTKASGVYLCRCCKAELFDAASKYDSGSGWPSFYQAAQNHHISEHLDRSHGMVRTEITCSRCNSHLGHLFTDGPAPAGLRYCVNSASLELQPDDNADSSK